MANHKLERALMGHEYCEGCNTIYPSPLFIAQHCYFCRQEAGQAMRCHGKHIGAACNCTKPVIQHNTSVLHFSFYGEQNWIGVCKAHAWQKCQNPLFHIARASI